mmetsp:Transcript_8521/g.14021  ORF Transcript_8521/g.14021 Transcript_8521/m.14021 type:complete len:96 (-) Transcript_8521:56-343(-)
MRSNMCSGCYYCYFSVRQRLKLWTRKMCRESVERRNTQIVATFCINNYLLDEIKIWIGFGGWREFLCERRNFWIRVRWNYTKDDEEKQRYFKYAQ